MKKHILYSPYVHILLIIFLAFLAFSNTFHVPFHFDDSDNIVENKKIRSLANIPSLFTDIRGPSIAARPFTGATFAINYYFGKLNTFGYHLFNLFIHILNAILLYLLITVTARILNYTNENQIQFIAFFSSLLFVLHPIQTESVTYIVTRSTLLATTFFLAGILLFIKAVSAQKKRGLYISALFFTSLSGMASREEFFLFPFMLILYDFFFISKYKIRAIVKQAGVHVPVLFTLTYLVYIVLSYDYEKHAGFAVKVVSPVEYLMTQFNVLWTYLRLLIMPVNQNIDHIYPLAKTLFEIPTFFAFSGYLGLWAAGILLYKRNPVLSFCILWFMITLAPSSSIIPIVDVIFEHRLYMPSIGFFVLVSMLLWRLKPSNVRNKT